MSGLRIAIVGAGIAGLGAALLLKRSGHEVTIYERFAKAEPVGSGLIIQPTGQAVLAELGLLEAAEMLSSRLDAIRGFDAVTGKTVLKVKYSALRGEQYGLGIGRGALFGLLHETALAQGIEIVTAMPVSAMRAHESGKFGLVCDGEAAGGGFDLIVDASGAGSLVRHDLFPQAGPKPNAYGALWASLDFHAEGFDAHALLQRYDKASVMIGVLPTGKDRKGGPERAAFFWSQKPAEHEALKAAGLNAWKDRVAAYWPQCAVYLDQIHDWDQLTMARYGRHTLARPYARGVAFIGDAAHSTSPQLGQGANMALLDAFALNRALRQGSDISQALLRYAAMRRFHVRLFHTLSAALTPFYQSDSTVLPFIRDRLAGMAALVPPGPQLLAAMITGRLGNPLGSIGLK